MQARVCGLGSYPPQIAKNHTKLSEIPYFWFAGVPKVETSTTEAHHENERKQNDWLHPERNDGNGHSCNDFIDGCGGKCGKTGRQPRLC